MLYNEKEVMEVCKKYGIETVKKNSMPLYKGKEMDENFSIAEIIHEPVVIKDGICDEVSDYMKYLHRKLKPRGEMYIIGIKIRFLQLKYLACKVKLKAIGFKEWVCLKVCDLKDRVLGIYQ